MQLAETVSEYSFIWNCLLRSGGAAFALTGAGGLLAACSNSTSAGSGATGTNGQKLGPLGLPLADFQGVLRGVPELVGTESRLLEPVAG